MLCEHGNIAPCVECDIEPMKAECEKLRAALKRLCNIYVVDDYYSGEDRERRLDEAVRRSIDVVGGLEHE